MVRQIASVLLIGVLSMIGCARQPARLHRHLHLLKVFTYRGSDRRRFRRRLRRPPVVIKPLPRPL